MNLLKQYCSLCRAQNLYWLLLSALVVLGDQLSKFWIFDYLQERGGGETLTSFLKLTLVFNDGAAFSFLQDSGGWQIIFFIGFAIIISLVLTYYLLSLPKQSYYSAIALSLIIGGAAGNLIDRIRLGYVIDFIHAHYHQWSWPVFNIADSAITIGAIMIVLSYIFSFDKE